MAFMFERLEVYQKAVNLAEMISLLSAKFPKGTYYLTDQLIRAVLSISLNIAEGNGRWHKLERRHFFLIARGSCHECIPILEICVRREFISAEQNNAIYQELETIAKMIAGLINGIRREKSRGTGER